MPLLIVLARRRTSTTAIIIGVYLGLYQFVKFGGCYFAGASLVTIDLVYAMAVGERLRTTFRFWLTAMISYLVIEGGRCLMFLTTLPAGPAWDVIWPQFTTGVYTPVKDLSPLGSTPARFAARTALPVVGAVAAVAAVVRCMATAGRACPVNQLAFASLSLFYLFGCFKYFGHIGHFTQYIWLPAVGAIAVLPDSRSGRRLGVLLAIASELLLVAAYYSQRSAPAGAEIRRMQNGDELYPLYREPVHMSATLDHHLRTRFGDDPLRTHRLFVHHVGAGYYFYTGTHHTGRQLWYLPGYVRPYDVSMWEHEIDNIDAIVFREIDSPVEGFVPTGDRGNWATIIFPPLLAERIRARAGDSIQLSRESFLIFLERPPAATNR